VCFGRGLVSMCAGSLRGLLDMSVDDGSVTLAVSLAGASRARRSKALSGGFASAFLAFWVLWLLWVLSLCFRGVLFRLLLSASLWKVCQQKLYSLLVLYSNHSNHPLFTLHKLIFQHPPTSVPSPAPAPLLRATPQDY
jgi:hypothetical protein